MERPLGVTILAVLAIVGGLLEILLGLFGVMLGGLAALAGISGLAGGIIALAIGWGFWNGKVWSWWAAVILGVLGLLGSFLGLLSSSAIGVSSLLSSSVALILNAVVLWYLFKPHVKSFFGVEVEFST